MEQPPRRPEGGDEQLLHEAEPTPWAPDAARARQIIEEGLNAAEGVDREIEDLGRRAHRPPAQYP